MKKHHIISIGLMGFPYGTAATQKLFHIGKSILDGNNTFKVISNTFVKKGKLNEKLVKSGSIDNIDFLTTSPYVFSPKSVLLKSYSKAVGLIKEALLLKRLRKKKQADAVIIYSWNFIYSFFISIYLKMLRIPVYIILFELRSEFVTRKKIAKKINDFLFERLTCRIANGIITISDKLIQHLSIVAPNKILLKVPPLTDFSLFDACTTNINQRYFLFCGSIGYLEIIQFIINSYCLLEEQKRIDLFLVLHGNDQEIELFEKEIADKNLSSSVKIYCGLPYQELVVLYKNASALLIPIRNTIQDIARFPQKIAEYGAAARPIITTGYGEIRRYFDDSSALIANAYDIEEFAEKMKFAVENEAKCDLIGKKGYEVGMKYFNYKSYTKLFNEFFGFSK